MLNEFGEHSDRNKYIERHDVENKINTKIKTKSQRTID